MASSVLRLDFPNPFDPSLPAKMLYDLPGPYISRLAVTSNIVPVRGFDCYFGSNTTRFIR